MGTVHFISCLQLPNFEYKHLPLHVILTWWSRFDWYSTTVWANPVRWYGIIRFVPFHPLPQLDLGGANHLHTSPHPSSYPWLDHGNMSCPSALMRIFKVQRLDKRGTYEVSRILLTPAKSAIFILIDQHLFRITICNMYWIYSCFGVAAQVCK